MPPRKKATPAAKAPTKKAAAKRSPRSSATAAKSARKRPAKKAAAPAQPARRRGRKPPPDPRLLDVLDARRGGASWDAIAASLKYADPAEAERAFAQAMQMLEVTSVSNQILLEHDRLDRLQAVLWPKALRGDVDALDRLLRVLEQRANRPRALDQREDRIVGPVEKATDGEVERLKKHAPALAAAALVLARAIDDNAGDPEKAAGIARELRISMTQLRGLAGSRPGEDDGDQPSAAGAVGGVVVPAGRLEALRGKVDSGYRAT